MQGALRVAVCWLGVSAAGAWAAEPEPGLQVSLTDPGPQKLQLLKAIREATGLGLREAKQLVESKPPALVKRGQKLVESAPVVVQQGLTREAAERLAKELGAAGGTAQAIDATQPGP